MKEKFPWSTKYIGKNDDELEPMGENFFINAEVLTLVSSLVRESVQNSIDARLDSTKPVRMRFHVGKMSTENEERYLSNLYPHVESVFGRRGDGKGEISKKYLVVEDFNTKGLKGNSTSARPEKDPLEPDKNSFYFFEWKTGESPKGATTLGKWGVGKVVFPFVSQIKSYFVFTSRDLQAAPDGDCNLLFGHNIMRFHDHDGKRCYPTHRSMQIDANGYERPFSDSKLISDFRTDWNLNRVENETGTSIVVPHCSQIFTQEAITQCIAQDYFIALLDSILECEISEEGSDSVTILNRDTLMSAIQELPSEIKTETSRTKRELIQLCNLYLSSKEPDTFKWHLKMGERETNDWELITPGEEIEALSQSLSHQETAEISISVRVPKRSVPNEFVEDSFTLLLKAEDGSRLDTTFCRQGILIPKASDRLVTPHDFLSLVIIRNGPLADFLGDAEDPSHKSWASTQSKFVENYEPLIFSKDTLQFVRLSANKIIQKMQQSNIKRDLDALNKFFPRPKEGNVKPSQPRVILTKNKIGNSNNQYELIWNLQNLSQSSAEVREILPSKGVIASLSSGNSFQVSILDASQRHQYCVEVFDGTRYVTSNIVEIAPTQPKNQKVQLSKTLGSAGFSISALPKKKIKKGTYIEVEVAFAQRETNGLRTWSAQDFILKDQLDLANVRGCTVMCVDNKAELLITDEDFFVGWINFPEDRDLTVEVNTRS
jgi:hypothetical protein